MRDPIHILITGASSGLGAAMALEYAAPGRYLSLHGRHTERLERLAELARERGASVSTHTGDVTNAQDLASWISARDAETEIDLIIANAGISGGTKSGEDADQFNAIMATNITGVFNTVHPGLSLMRKRRRGQIALVSSLAGFRGFGGAAAYCGSKAAVRVYGEGLRALVSDENIEISVICPGFVKTPMTDINPFHMPWIISAESAAQIIRKGLTKGRARIAFPWRSYAFTRLLAALPEPILDFIAKRLPVK